MPVAIVTPEFEELILSIRRRHVVAVWTILSEHVGHESAIKRPELVRRVRLAIRNARYTDRCVRDICKSIRNAGIPVCSDRQGYWIGTPTETLAWAKWYRSHAFTMLTTAGVLVRGALHLLNDKDERQEAEQLQETIQLALDLGKEMKCT